MLKHFVVIAIAASLCGMFTPSAYAAPSSVTHDNGVLVKKNADGTIDVSDDAPGAASDAGAQNSGGTPGVTYRYNTHPGTRNIGGVKVRTNPDGSIETFDNESSYTPVRARSHKRTVKRATKTSHH